jgi:MerR family transcriptional regulator, light-induced transcriptional regulator
MNASFADLITTSQAAALLQVHESSVKRWSNSDGLTSQKTTGGHRRLALAELFAFAKQKNITADILALYPHEEEVAVACLAALEKNDFTELRDLILKFCDILPSRNLSKLLLYAENVIGIPLSKLYDEAVGGALREVGRQWQSGSRTIALEHRFTQKVVDALYAKLAAMEYENEQRVSPVIPLSQTIKAVVGCAEGCYHEIGGLMSRIILQKHGYEVTYLGPNSPFEEVAGIQEIEEAKIVCLSFVPPLNASDMRRCLKVMGALYNPLKPYTLVVGGAASEMGGHENTPGPFQLVKAISSIDGFERWIKNHVAGGSAL